MSLPSGYKKLQYVTATTEAFLRLNQDFGTPSYVDIYIDCVTNSSSAFWGGSDTSYVSEGYYAGARTSGSSIVWYSDDEAGTISGVWSNGVRHVYEWHRNKSPKGTLVDGNLVKSCGDFAGYGNLYVLYGKFPTSGSKYYFSGDIYEIRVADHVFEPALRVSDNVAGFYCDNGVFYPSGGDADFIAGPVEKKSSIYKGTSLVTPILHGERLIEHVYYRGFDLLGGGTPPTPVLEYDYVDQNERNEVDILYTTDTHLAWLNSGSPAYSENPTFYLSDIAYYKDKLWNAGIPAFCVDCGDWVHGNGNTETLRNAIIDTFNNLGNVGYKKYLAVTFGNHEWYSAMGNAEACMSYLRRVTNMTACNLLSGGQPCFKPYRAIKIGSKKIGIIGIGYPSANGRPSYPDSSDTHTFEGYQFLDSRRNDEIDPNRALYKQVQGIIDMFKSRNFDYIIAITHMDKSSDEDFWDDERFNARADYLIQNTSGLDLVIPGHYNYAINNTYSVRGLDGNYGMIVQEAGASLHNIGRIRIRFNESQPIQSYLLDDRGDLEVI